MSRVLRVGVIGAGNMGTNHARVYSMFRHAELVGVSDTDAARAHAVAQRYQARAFRSYTELLPEVDAVSIAVPTPLHHEVAQACLEMGLHVLVEKPLTLEVVHGERLLAEADRRGLVLEVGHIERFNPAVIEVGEVVRDERILAISARRLSPPTPQVVDVDVVLDLLIHDLDIVSRFAASPVARLSAMGTGGASLDLVMAHLEFQNGILADLVASRVTQQRVRELEITTDKAFISVNYRTRDVSIYRRGLISAQERADHRHRQDAVIEKPFVEAVEPLYLELDHFLRRIGDRTLKSGAADAVAALRLATRVRDEARAK